MAKKAGKIPDECVSEKPGTKNALRMRECQSLVWEVSTGLRTAEDKALHNLITIIHVFKLLSD